MEVVEGIRLWGVLGLKVVGRSFCNAFICVCVCGVLYVCCVCIYGCVQRGIQREEGRGERKERRGEKSQPAAGLS